MEIQSIAIYLVFLVVSQLDDVFFPGNNINTGILSELPGIDDGSSPEIATDINERINLLVLGLDRKVGGFEGAERTDTIFILSIDPFSKTAGVLSIPRDLVVSIPDNNGNFSQGRINTAYQYGEQIIQDYPGGGPGLAMDTIKYNFDIPIDHYMIINFESFINLINEIGGIDINVPAYRASTNFSNCQGCPGYFVEFFAGPQHMDGEAALTYARIRQNSSDLDRIERQQLVMHAVSEKMLGLNLLSPSKLTSLYSKFKDSIDTDIADWQIPGLALLANGVGEDNLTTISLNSAVELGRLGDASVLYADWDKVEELKNQIFIDSALRSELALIHIHNLSDNPDLPDEIRDFLISQGLYPERIVVLGESNVLPIDQPGIYNITDKVRTTEIINQWINTPIKQLDVEEIPEEYTESEPMPDIVIMVDDGTSIPDLEN